jgi:tRNA G18 (ribose-2'-O)-methylase SpoU
MVAGGAGKVERGAVYAGRRDRPCALRCDDTFRREPTASGVSDSAPAIEAIADPADPRLDDYRDLRDHQLRLRHGLFVAESRSIVRLLLAARRFRTRSVLLTPAALAALRPDLAAAEPATRVLVASHPVIRAVSGFDFHRGCLAVGERGADAAPGVLIDPPGPRLVLVLEKLSNPDNVGGVFRNAMAFGVDAVLLSAGCADPLYRKTIRVSVGGALRVPFARLADWPASLPALRATGYVIAALTPGPDALPLERLGERGPLPDRLALVVGAEGPGLCERTRAMSDVQVRIDMPAGVDSLNVSTATGIALHWLRRSRGYR